MDLLVWNFKYGGIATFKNLTPGNYWIMGVAQYSGGPEADFWNVKVKVGIGQNKILLNHSNNYDALFGTLG
jgi:hypothetical protein